MISLMPLSKWCDENVREYSENKQLFEKIKTFITTNSKLKQARDIYPFYSDILKIAQIINENPEKKRVFVDILSECNGQQVTREKTFPLILDFDPILRVIKENKEFFCTSSIVDRTKMQQVEEVAKAIHELSEEGLGHSFGLSIYKTVIQSPNSSCIVVRDSDQHIIGCVLGTSLEIEEKNLKGFHFWLCVRKANYPGICLVNLLQHFENSVIEQHHPHYFSLNVDEDNESAKNLYEKSGFAIKENVFSPTTNKQVLFMVKTLEERNEMPNANETERLIRQNTLTILGMTGLAHMIHYKAKMLFRNFRYQ